MKKFKDKEVIEEKELSNHAGFLVYKMIGRNIDSMLKNKKPLESVIISRMKYDQLEDFLFKYGVRTEDNHYAPLTYQNIELKRAESATMIEFTPIFRPTLTEKELLMKLDENAAEMNIGKGGTLGQQALDKAFKGIKHIKNK